jgi:hypothetical protein
VSSTVVPFTVNYSNIASLSFHATPQADVVNVTPGAGIAMTVDGGGGFKTVTGRDPPTVGDLLNFNAPGLTVRVKSGMLQADGTPPVNFSAFESVYIDGTAAVIAIAGPDTTNRGDPSSDRSGSDFTGMNAQQQYVQVLYLNELGRPASSDEIAQWTPLLTEPFSDSSGTATEQRQAVAAAIASSPEAQDHLVKSWYISFLGRPSQNGEEMGFVNMLEAGQSEEQVLSGLLSSDEFMSRAQTLTPGSTSAESYVQALYKLLLGRTASSSEVSTQAGNVAALGAQQVAQGILGSTEYRLAQFEGFYNALLHRPDDATGLNDWVFSSLDMHSSRVGFDASPEFFNNG